MCVRFLLLLFSVPMMVCGAICETVGSGIIPYEVRNLLPVEWAAEHPRIAFFGFAIVFVLALLYKPARMQTVSDFRG